MNKQSDLALEGAIEDSWNTLRRADLRRRTVRAGMIGLGLSAAVLTPILNLPDTTEALPTAATTYNTTVHPPSDGGQRLDTIPYFIPYPMYQKKPVPGPATRSAKDHKVEVVTELNIRSASASKLWHRSAFEAQGDEFWALPDASFKLVLASPVTGNRLRGRACGTTACSADFTASFSDSAGQASSVTIEVRGRNIATTSAAGPCNRVQDNIPYLRCNLPAASPSMQQRTCLWMRRVAKAESGEERVALEIRWENRGASSGSGCTL